LDRTQNQIQRTIGMDDKTRPFGSRLAKKLGFGGDPDLG
jgi:hypothetical protein